MIDHDLGPPLSSDGPRRAHARRVDGQLIGLADRMGIDRLVIYMGQRTVVDPSPEELRRQNDQVLQASATGTTARSGSCTSTRSTSRRACARSIDASATGRWSG